MKYNHIFFGLLTLLLAACSNNKEESKQTKADQTVVADKSAEPVVNNTDLQAPNFTDPELKAYYSNYTDYIKKVVAAIRNKDEATAMTLFREEGKLFSNQNEMEKRAKLADEAAFNTWLRQAITYQQEVVQSVYFKKYNDEYYKKVKEDFDKKNN